MPRHKNSALWSHFTETRRARARCLYCLKEVSTAGGSTGNLVRHLRTRHSQVIADQGYMDDGQSVEGEVSHFVDIADGGEGDLSGAGVRSSMKPRRRSRMWAHFIHETKGRPRCVHCSREVSIVGGSTGNLMRHLRLKHPLIFSVDRAAIEAAETRASVFSIVGLADAENQPQEQEPVSENDPGQEPDPAEGDTPSKMQVACKRQKRKSGVWSHFTVQPGGRARCVYCSRMVCFGHGSTGNLSRHIKTKHPTVIMHRAGDDQMRQGKESPTIIMDFEEMENTEVGEGENYMQAGVPEIQNVRFFVEKRAVYDLCIIGAGRFGSAAARHASANPSLKVVLIGPQEMSKDGRKGAEAFCSYYEGESPASAIDEQLPLQKFIQSSVKRFEELEKLSGNKFYYPMGFLAFGQNSHQSTQEVKKSVVLGNIPSVCIKQPELLKARYPFLRFRPDEIAFLDDNGAGYISEYGIVDAQRKVAEMQGCEIINDIVKNVFPLQNMDSCFCHRICLEHGLPVFARRVLICTGAFTSLACLTPGKEANVPWLNIIRETAAVFEVTAEEAQHLCAMPAVRYCGSTSSCLSPGAIYVMPPVENTDDLEGLYYVKMSSSSAGSSDDPDIQTIADIREWYQSEGDEKTLQNLSAVLADLMPNLKVHSIKSSPFITCNTPSSLPFVERISPTVAIAVGGGSKSAQCSDEVGRLAAELTVNGRWDSDVPQSLFSTIWRKS